MYNYLIFLNCKAVKGYYNLKRALNAYEQLSLVMDKGDYLELWSRQEGLLKETY